MPYYIVRIQQRQRYVKLRWFDQHFPDHEVIVEIDNPNSIHAFNRFQEEGHVERKYNHFRLIDLTQEEFYTSCCFQVNNQRQKTSEGIALMFLFPHVRQQLSNKSHAMEIEDLTSCVQALEFTNEACQQAIEEKDAAIALLNDDLQNREYENVGSQGEIRAKDEQIVVL